MDKKALSKLSYGVYIVCSRKGNMRNGQVVNAAMQISSSPAKIAVSISKNNLTHEYIKNSGYFTLSVLSVDADLGFIGNFGFKSGRDVDKFTNVECSTANCGVPILEENAVAWMECKVNGEIHVGSHTIFIGDVVDAAILSDRKVMTYDYYHNVVKGKTSKNAPTYIDEKKEKGGKNMDKYVCTVCGYIYDPDAGDPDNGIDPGMPFESLPDNWVCPLCGAPKDAFEKTE